MKKILEVFIFVLAFTFQSCSEGDNESNSGACNKDCSKITGKLTTDFGTVPIVNHKVTVFWQKIGENAEDNPRATTMTDANGDFNLEFYIPDEELDRDLGSYILIVDELDREEFLQKAWNDIPIHEIQRNTTLIRNYNVPKKAFVNLSLVHLEAINEVDGDYFGTNFEYAVPQDYYQSVARLILSHNNLSKSQQTITIPANTPIELQIIRKNKDIQHLEQKSVYASPGETLDYVIDYNN